MKTRNKSLILTRVIVTVILLFGAVITLSVSAGPLPQDPRPDRGGGGTGGGGGGTGGGAEDNGQESNGASAATVGCASLVGQMVNWGSGGEGGITSDLIAGSWQLSTVSATDGNYGYGGLGVGAAILHVALSPEQVERFTPLIQDAGVYLNCDFPIVANIALFSGEPIAPPATIDMSASRTSLTAGQQAEITLTVQNSLPNDISNVVVTDLFPPGLTPVEVSSSAGAGSAKIVSANGNGQLVVVNLGQVASGAEALIGITVMAEPELALSAQLSNTATLFYRESAAHQSSLDFTVRGGGLTVPVAAPTATPLLADSFTAPMPEAVVSATPEAAAPAEISPAPTEETEEGEDFVPPNGLPTTGDNFVPPPVLLPVTGQESTLQLPAQLPNTGLSPVLPLSGLGLAGLALVLHRLRVSMRNASMKTAGSEKNKVLPASNKLLSAKVRQQNIDTDQDLELDFSPLSQPPPGATPRQNQE